MVATVGEFKQFRVVRSSVPGCGLVPRQHSSGGKNNLGRHHQTRRHLPAQPVDSRREVGSDERAQTQRSDLAVGGRALRDRAGWQKATVALANKNARILWAVMTKGEAFDARHVSVKPGTPMPAAAPAA